MKPITPSVVLAAAALFSVQRIAAADATKPVEPAKAAAVGEVKEPSIFDAVWKRAELYKNDDNPLVQSFAFTGRYQLDYAILDHDNFEEFNTRRWRMGAKAKLFHDFTLHGEVELHHDEDPWYQRLTDMYLAWSPREEVRLTVGKHSAPFTDEGSTSSKELLTIDRSNLANNLWFPQEYFPGVSASGDVESWQYLLGVYSSGSANKEFGEFNGGYFTLASVGYNFAQSLDVDEALLTASYVYNEPDSQNSFTRDLQHVGSLNFRYDVGRWGFRSDVSGGLGYLGQSDLWGAMLMPYYNITEKFQAVLRYTYLHSVDPGGIRFSRYESFVVSAEGDDYNEIYLGLNYYIYKHKLKLQTGVQYVEMDDDANAGGNYNGWGWTSGLRVSW